MLSQELVSEEFPVQWWEWDAVRRTKTIRCNTELPNPLVEKTTLCRRCPLMPGTLCGTSRPPGVWMSSLTPSYRDHPVQVMSHDARDAVRRAKTARCKNELPNPFVQKTTQCRWCPMMPGTLWGGLRPPGVRMRSLTPSYRRPTVRWSCEAGQDPQVQKWAPKPLRTEDHPV